MIYLEPREIYDVAIIKKDGEKLIYCFWSIVDALTESGWDEIDAIEHICYNIQSISIPGWPIIVEINRDK